MSLNARQEIRWLLDQMTAVVNSPEIGRQAQRAAIRDFSDQFVAQVKVPLLPSLEPPKPIFDESGTMWL